MAKQLIQLRVEREWLEHLDDWRRGEAVEQHRDISRSEAIRMLVKKGLALEESFDNSVS